MMIDGTPESVLPSASPIRTMPSSPRPARLPTATARSACASVRRASSRKTAPAGVSATERGPRDNSWALNAASSAWICVLKDGCAIPNRSAARPKCSSSASATK